MNWIMKIDNELTLLCFSYNHFSLLHLLHLVLLVSLNLLEVKFEFLTFKDVTVATTRLTGTGGDNGVKATSSELVINQRFNFSEILTSGLFLLDAVGFLGSIGSSSFSDTLLTQNFTVMRFIPLTEGSSIDLDNGTLDEGLGTDKFIVGSIVNDINDTSLTRNGFTTPTEGTGI